MYGKLSVKVLLRAPVKTAITLLLLIATSFAFISRGAEFATTVHEINKVEASYTAVGTLERSTEGYYEYMEDLLGPEVYGFENGAYIDRLSNATAPLEAEVVDIVLGSEHIAQDEFIMVAGGLTHEYENVIDQPLYDIPISSEFWNEETGTFRLTAGFVETTYHYTPWNNVNMGPHLDKVIVGSSEMYRALEAPMYNVINMEMWYTSATEGKFMYRGEDADQRRFFWAVDIDGSGAHQAIRYLDYPVVDITKLEKEYGISDPIVALKHPDKYGLTKFRSATGTPVVSTLDYMETVYRNLHTNEMVFVSDMEVIHKYHNEDLYIHEGRAITNKDTANVCVVSADYAQKNGLAVGDTIEYELCADTMMHSGKVFGREPPYPATAGRWDIAKPMEEWIIPLASEQSLTERGLDTVTRTYEIVGIWSDSNYDVADPFSYSPNTVFVPASTYPWAGEVEPTMLPSTFSFTLNHPGDMAKMQAELGDQLAALGYELSVDDMGYSEAAPSLDFMKLSALVSFVAMSFALLLSLALVVYLFILRRRHDYAIMRALGMPESRANNTLLLGLLTLSAVAVMLAGLMSLVVTQNFAAELSVQLAEITGVETVTTLPSWLVGVFAAGVLILLIVFARVGLIKVGRTPPLRLLQGGR